MHYSRWWRNGDLDNHLDTPGTVAQAVLADLAWIPPGQLVPAGTYTRLARELGTSRQRVHQIATAAGYQSRKRRNT